MFYCHLFQRHNQNSRALPSSRPTPDFFQLISAVAEAGGKGAALVGGQRSCLGQVSIGHGGKSLMGDQTEKPHSNTSLEVIKQQHRQINANQNQPQKSKSATRHHILSERLVLSKLASLTALCYSSKHKHSLVSKRSIKNSNSERGNSKFTSAEYMFSLNSCTGNQTFC